MDMGDQLAPLLGVGVDFQARDPEGFVGLDDIHFLGVEDRAVLTRPAPVERLGPSRLADEDLVALDAEVGDAPPVELEFPQRQPVIGEMRAASP